jgi:hypothetical protein
MASGSRVLALRLAAGQPGQRIALTRSYGDVDGFREGDVGTVLWTDDAIHLEMDAGPMLTISDEDGVRRLDSRPIHLPGVA